MAMAFFCEVCEDTIINTYPEEHICPGPWEVRPIKAGWKRDRFFRLNAQSAERAAEKFAEGFRAGPPIDGARLRVLVRPQGEKRSRRYEVTCRTIVEYQAIRALRK